MVDMKGQAEVLLRLEKEELLKMFSTAQRSDAPWPR